MVVDSYDGKLLEGWFSGFLEINGLGFGTYCLGYYIFGITGSIG